jgi:hypothetical protein
MERLTGKSAFCKARKAETEINEGDCEAEAGCNIVCDEVAALDEYSMDENRSPL